MKVLSLFDGISCGMIALERAGISVHSYHAYEIDPYAIKISKKNYPCIEQHGDVSKEDFGKYNGIDLLMGGSPCQSLSIVRSKDRKNLDGKSKLFFEFVRAKEESSPKWFLFENVASMNEESRNVISEYLGCEPVFIDSGNFCAQERPRLYWTNIDFNKSNLPFSEETLSDIMLPAEEVDKKYWYDFPLKEIDMTKKVCAKIDKHWNNDTMLRIFNPMFKCHTLLAMGGGHTQKKVLQNGRPRKLTPIEYERLQTLPDNYTEGVSDTRRYSAIGNGWTVDVIAYILGGIKQ